MIFVLIFLYFHLCSQFTGTKCTQITQVNRSALPSHRFSPGVLGVVRPGMMSRLCRSIMASTSVCTSNAFMRSGRNTWRKDKHTPVINNSHPTDQDSVNWSQTGQVQEMCSYLAKTPGEQMDMNTPVINKSHPRNQDSINRTAAEMCGYLIWPLYIYINHYLIWPLYAYINHLQDPVIVIWCEQVHVQVVMSYTLDVYSKHTSDLNMLLAMHI